MSSATSEISSLLNGTTGKFRSGDVDRIVELAMARLVSLARQMLGANPRLRRWEETNDVVQIAAMRLYRSLQDVQPRSSHEFFGLATVQIRRTLIDLARKHFGPHGDARRHLSDPLLLRQMRADDSCEPCSLAEWTAFHVAVEELPDEEQAVFESIYYGGATYEEAALFLGVSRRTAIRRMNRARLCLSHRIAIEELCLE